MSGRSPDDTPLEIHVGVLLDDLFDDARDDNAEDDGIVLAWGQRGRHASSDRRLAVLGQSMLRAAAEAVGKEIAIVAKGVITGMEVSADQPDALRIEELELKFGVKATLGTGKAIEALLTAQSEATIEVTLKLRKPAPDVPVASALTR